MVPHSHVVVKSCEEYLCCGGAPEERGVPAPHQKPRAPPPERGAPTTSGCENQWGFYHLCETEGCWKPSCPLRGLHTDLLTCRHSPWGLVMDSGLGVSRDIQRENELSGFRVRAGSTDAIVPVLSLPHSRQAGARFPVLNPLPIQPNQNLH